jgi:hypothetical protein
VPERKNRAGRTRCVVSPGKNLARADGQSAMFEFSVDAVPNVLIRPRQFAAKQ